MKAFGSQSQQGQATTEFLAAMAVFVPLFFGIIYVGKFGDIKHQAIQASRYAALERALDPLPPPARIAAQEEAIRARFFTDGASIGGKLTNNDTTIGLRTDGTLNPLWYEINGTPLLQSYSDPSTGVRVTVTSNSMDIGAFTPINEASRGFDHLNRDGQMQADVEVPISNIAHLPRPLNAMNLKVAARTVMAGDTWSGGGSPDVASEQTWLTDVGKNPAVQALGLMLAPLAAVFSDSAPQFGCVRPDVVPGQTAPGANYQPNDPCY
jgi:hypothetical protein